MPADVLMSVMAKREQWDLAEQLDICLEYIDRQKDDPAFQEFLAEWALLTNS